MGSLSTAVEGCLRHFGYPFEREQYTYLFNLISSSGRIYPAEVVLYPESMVIQLFIYTDQFVPAQRYAWFRELICALNGKVVCGTFLVRWTDCSYPCYRL